MRKIEASSEQMFENVPRPWGLAGALTIGLWVLLALAFVTDAIPSAPSDEWLYQLEAAREGWAHRLSANEVRAPAQVAARRAAAAHRTAVVVRDGGCSAGRAN